jgi:predicted dehydrogenase
MERNIMTQSPIPVVVVGTGFGCRIQVPALRGAGFSVEALVGTDPARTEERARANGVPRAFVDLDEAIAATGAVLVAISTPPFTHAELALRAFEKGCHVLCEKPFARDTAEAKRMLAAARASGRLHALGNEFRFAPARATVARCIAQGMIGEPRFASMVQLMGFVATFREDFPDWWFDPAQGGGWLGASGSHAIDQIRTWLGEFDTLSASISNVSLPGSAVDDSFAMRFRLKSGLEGVLQQSCGAFGGMTEIIRIAGTEGSIWMDGMQVRFADRSGERELPIPPELQLSAGALGDDPRNERLDWQLMAEVEIAPYTELCRSIRAAISGSEQVSPVPMATFEDGVANMEVMDAICASATDGGQLVTVG